MIFPPKRVKFADTSTSVLQCVLNITEYKRWTLEKQQMSVYGALYEVILIFIYAANDTQQYSIAATGDNKNLCPADSCLESHC